jgi:uncharacterized phage protein gp47/JayE
MLLKKTRTEMVAESLQALVDDGKLTNVTAGSTVRLILESMTTHLGVAYSTMQLNMAMSILSTANGYFLDLIGESLFGIVRSTAVAASTTIDDPIVKFYTSDGSPLVSHLVGTSIPAGTRIYSANDTLTYTVTHDVAVGSAQVEAYVPVHAASAGEGYNVGTGVLVKHSLPDTTLKVTNIASIDNGLSDEEDDNYKFRISRALKTYSRANATAVRLAAVSVPGVADVILTSTASGVGTFDMLVLPIGNRVGSETLRAVQSAVNFVKAVGILSSVREPDYVPIELVIRVKFQPGTSEARQFDAKEKVVNAVLGYIGEIPMAGTFVKNELVQRVMEVDAQILDMEILCYIFSNRPQLLRSYVLGAGELLLPDPSKTEPIKVI